MMKNLALTLATITTLLSHEVRGFIPSYSTSSPSSPSLIAIGNNLSNKNRKQFINDHQTDLFSPSPPPLRVSTELYDKKWNPRWNQKPDSEYYRRKDDGDLYGYSIHYAGKNRRSKYIPKFRRTGLFSLQRFLVLLNATFFLKQIQSAINYLPILNQLLDRSGYPYEFWTKLDILEQFILGSSPITVAGKMTATLGARGRAYGRSLNVASSLGPFTMDFVNQRLLTRIQPHRYLTSGGLHGSLMHLIFNMSYLWRMPRWVENNGGTGNGLSGWFLYLTTYLSSIVAGNLARDYFSSSGAGMATMCLGASGGICGLNGLMFVMLQKMGNSNASVSVLKNMLFMILFGTLSSGISNASHIGGFICGAIMGWLFGPNYIQGYSRRRLNLDGDEGGAPLDYQFLMGSGIEPAEANFPLRYFWAGVGLLAFIRPEILSIPVYIWKGFSTPGALSGLQ